MNPKVAEFLDHVISGIAVAGLWLAIKKIWGYLTSSQLELFWSKVDRKINAAIVPIVEKMEDFEKELHETKKTQEAIQLKTLETLEKIDAKLGESNV